MLPACEAERVLPLPVAELDVLVPACQCLRPFACSHQVPAAASVRHCEAVLRLHLQQPERQVSCAQHFDAGSSSASGSCMACLMWLLGAAGKKPEDQMFDTMDAGDLNKRLKDLMDGLSVKVCMLS